MTGPGMLSSSLAQGIRGTCRLISILGTMGISVPSVNLNFPGASSTVPAQRAHQAAHPPLELGQLQPPARRIERAVEGQAQVQPPHRLAGDRLVLEIQTGDVQVAREPQLAVRSARSSAASTFVVFGSRMDGGSTSRIRSSEKRAARRSMAITSGVPVHRRLHLAGGAPQRLARAAVAALQGDDQRPRRSEALCRRPASPVGSMVPLMPVRPRSGSGST